MKITKYIKKLSFNRLVFILLIAVVTLGIVQVLILEQGEDDQDRLNLNPEQEITEEYIDEIEEEIQVDENGDEYLVLQNEMTLDQFMELREELLKANEDLEISPDGILFRKFLYEQKEEQGIEGELTTE